MSASELAPFVAAVIRDYSNNEVAEENEALRAELQAERQSRRRVAITARDGTVFAEGTLEGATPSDSDDIAPGTIKVEVTMVDGVRPCTLKDLDGLTIRIGGINAYSIDDLSGSCLSESGAIVRDFSHLAAADDSHYHLFLGWPTKLTLALLLAFDPAPEMYPMELDGCRMELDGISFKCGPKSPGRPPLDADHNLSLGEDEIEEVVFKTIMFSSFVGAESRSLTVLVYSPGIFE